MNWPYFNPIPIPHSHSYWYLNPILTTNAFLMHNLFPQLAALHIAIPKLLYRLILWMSVLAHLPVLHTVCTSTPHYNAQSPLLSANLWYLQFNLHSNPLPLHKTPSIQFTFQPSPLHKPPSIQFTFQPSPSTQPTVTDLPLFLLSSSPPLEARRSSPVHLSYFLYFI